MRKISVTGIIAEFNPLHKGHEYLITEARKKGQVICVISGNFVQRGDTAIAEKAVRTEAALNCGADLVIELPVLYSISSAEDFAYGAIKILKSLKVVNHLSFGSECGNLEILNDFANVLTNEPPEFQGLLKHELSKGLSFPKARENAALLYLNDIRKYSNILNCPNNTLGIEYLKALKTFKSNRYNIQPLTVQRQAVPHNSLDNINGFASGTAIREMVYNNEYDRLFSSIPKSSYEILLDSIRSGEFVTGLNCLEKEILYKLRYMSKEDISNLPWVSEGLENTIKDAVSNCNTLEELIDKIKSKRFTRTRIQRILLYALLGYTREDLEFLKQNSPYVRVLGFSSKGKSLLSKICKSNKKLELITSVKQYEDNCKNKKLINILKKDIRSTDIYTLGYKQNSKANLDYTHKLIIL